MLGQQIINGVMLGSVYAMVAVALTLSIGVLNFLNFSIPGLFMIAGMATWGLIHGGRSLAVGGPGRAGDHRGRVARRQRFTWRWLRGAEPFVPLVSSMAFLLLFEHLAIAWGGSEMRVLPSLFAGTDIGASAVSSSACRNLPGWLFLDRVNLRSFVAPRAHRDGPLVANHRGGSRHGSLAGC